MVLIEGLGDEVTLVLGSFFIIFISLLAWLSTHTDDIPLIREMGVIVVELRQRHRNRQTRTEQPQEHEISQSSREGIASTEQESVSENSSLEENGPQEDGRSVGEIAVIEQRSDSDTPSSSLPVSPSEAPASSQSASVSASDLQPDVKRIPTSSSQLISEQDHEQLEATADFERVDSVNNVAFTSGDIEHDSETNEQALRRRRVQYFQTGSSNVYSEGITSGDEKSGNVADITNQISSLELDDETGRVECVSEEVRPLSHSNDEPRRENDVPPQQTNQPVQGREVKDSNDFIDTRIRVKLKYMNETQRFVYASPGDTIGDFRRAHFQSELSDNKWVRFIFNGQDLRDDARTLQACNIENNCTMHCLVTTQHRPGERQEAMIDDEEESMLGSMMYPLFTLLLLVVWYFRIFYRQYFSAMSTVCLIGISFLLALSYISSMRNTANGTPNNTNPGQQPAAQATTVNGDGQQNHPHSD